MEKYNFRDSRGGGGPFSSGENGKKLDKMRKQILFQEELNRIHDRENKYKERMQKGEVL
jgi:hypothetical protein